MNCSVCYEHHNVSTSFFSVFPAGAGMIPSRVCPLDKGRSFPRKCGGDPPTDEIYVIDQVISPYIGGAPCLCHSQKSMRLFFRKWGFYPKLYLNGVLDAI